MTLALLGRCVLDSFADYGALYAGCPNPKVEPTRWQEENLTLLLDVPPDPDCR